MIFIETGFVCADTITKLGPESQGAVIVSGSHGGVYPGYLAHKAKARAVILHDAGVGKDRAGIGSLDYCQQLGMAAAVVDYRSACIGNTDDMLANGRISHCNHLASENGCEPGMACLDAARALRKAPLSGQAAKPYPEARYMMDCPGPKRVICLDSVSLVRPEDAGQIIITGSHGGLVGGNKAMALRVDAFAAAYNDAGVGKEQAGVARLPVLAERGILAATVAASSARIGDGRSTYEDGTVSALNEPALAAGGQVGMAMQALVELWQSLS